MQKAQQILDIIKNYYFNDEIDEEELMYTHGDATDFGEIISDIEDEFDLVINESNYPTDIGEMKVSDFVKHTLSLIQDDRL